MAYAYVFNGKLTPVEFLQYIAGDLGLPAAGKNKSELLLQLAQYVITRSQKKLTTVLVVDEAHHLSTDILEEIRLLTNLETADEKLLQILLVGQPELDEKLDSVELRQLKQRIALRSHLASLDLNETRAYIERRLTLAGSPDRDEIVSAGDHGGDSSPLPRDSATDQYRLRERADCRLFGAGSERDSGDDRHHRRRLPAGGADPSRGADSERGDAQRAESGRDPAGTLYALASRAAARRGIENPAANLSRQES